MCTGDRIWTSREGSNELKVQSLLRNDDRERCPRKVAAFLPDQYVKTTISTPLNLHLLEDTPIWPMTHSGIYTVKSGYFLALDEMVTRQYPYVSNSEANKSLWRKVWGARVQPKIKHFIWKALKGILPTRVNLRKKKIPLVSVCPICRIKDETVEHLLDECDWVRAVWFGSYFDWHVENEGCANMQHWFVSKLDMIAKFGGDTKWQTALFYNYLWSIWKARNEYIFEGRKINPEFIIKRAEENMKEFWEANDTEKPEESAMETNQNHMQRWNPPMGYAVKLNCDAAFDSENLIGACAVLVRDRDGDLLTGSSRLLPCMCLSPAG